MININTKLVFDYIDKLLENQNINTDPAYKNMIKFEDYHKILAPVILMFDPETDIDIIRHQLISKSVIIQEMRRFVHKKRLVTGSVLCFGTKNCVVNLYCGNKFETQSGYMGHSVEYDDRVVAVNSMTLMDLNAVTKSFVFALAMHLNRVGIINVFDKVANLNPNFEALGNLRLIDLLNGAYSYKISNRIYDELMANEIYNCLSGVRGTANSDGSDFHYCDIGYIVFKFAVEFALSTNLGAIIDDNFLKVYNFNLTFHDTPSGFRENLMYYNNAFTVNKNKFDCIKIPRGVPVNRLSRIFGSYYGFSGNTGLFSVSNDIKNHMLNIINGIYISDDGKKLTDNADFIRQYAEKELIPFPKIKDPSLGLINYENYLSGLTTNIEAENGVYMCVDPINKVFQFAGSNSYNERLIEAKEIPNIMERYRSLNNQRMMKIDEERDRIITYDFALLQRRYYCNPMIYLSLQLSLLEYLYESHNLPVPYTEINKYCDEGKPVVEY